MKISIGRIVHYRLSESDVEQVTRRRNFVPTEPWPVGAQRHVGNHHNVGQILPMIVCNIWPNERGPSFDGVNGQVFLDGNDSLWVTSAMEGTEPGTWSWPERVSG